MDLNFLASALRERLAQRLITRRQSQLVARRNQNGLARQLADQQTHLRSLIAPLFGLRLLGPEQQHLSRVCRGNIISQEVVCQQGGHGRHDEEVESMPHGFLQIRLVHPRRGGSLSASANGESGCPPNWALANAVSNHNPQRCAWRLV